MTAARDLQAEMLGGHVLQGVGLVEDGDLVIGQQARPVPAQGEVAEEQGVIDDEQVRAEDLLAGLEVEAFA